MKHATIEILEEGGKIDQETRLFDTSNGQTRSMRNKEDAHDYRYFPDPDLLPVRIGDDLIDRIKSETSIKDIRIIKLSKNNYRVLLGPYNDINSLKESFDKMDSLYFENLEILKNV